MNQRQEILQAWNRYSATAYRSPQFQKAQAFFQMMQQRPARVWVRGSAMVDFSRQP